MTEVIESVPVHPAIAGLLHSLPHPEQHWPVIEQEQFLVAMRRVFELIYTYPAPPTDPKPGEYEPGDIPAPSAEAPQ